MFKQWTQVCIINKQNSDEKLDFVLFGWGSLWYIRHQQTNTHAKQKLQMCLFTIKMQLTRGNNTEYVKGKENKTDLCVSAGPASRLGRTTVWDITQENASSRRTQQATLVCKCMQENFRKAKITEPNEVAALKLSGLWIITACFIELSSISCETMTSVV